MKKRTIRSLLQAFLLFFATYGTLPAQSVDTTGPVPVLDEATAGEARDIVDRFFRYGSDPSGVDSTGIPDYAIDWFAGLLMEGVGRPFWPIAHRYDVGDVYAIRPEGGILMVTSRTYVDSVPYHGRVIVDWIWYLRQNQEEEWRISSVRRTRGLLDAMNTLRFIDTTAAYPTSIKPYVAREAGGVLLDNGRLRTWFEENRSLLDELVTRLESTDGAITMLEREGARVRQFNTKFIDWGLAAEDVPEDALEEFLADAPEDVRENILRRIEVADRHAREASAILAETARSAGVRPAEVEEIARLMKLGRVRFVNTDLPFSDAILLTIGGAIEQAVGYLYSPSGELPWINPEEYFYLEELGDGWWIFRSA